MRADETVFIYNSRESGAINIHERRYSYDTC